MDKIQTGLSEKLVLTAQWISTFLCGFTLGFVRDWRLTLALLAVVPFLALGGALMAYVSQ